MCPILSTLFEAVGAIQVKQKEAKVAVASHGIEVFFFFFLVGPDFIQKNRERKTTKPKTQLHTVVTQKQQQADTRKALSLI